jgi:CheY-like chemotaxis protein
MSLPNQEDAVGTSSLLPAHLDGLTSRHLAQAEPMWLWSHGQATGSLSMERKSLRILVVDDRPDSADSLALLLTVVGHQVEVAYGGEECLAKATASRFDAVLLDIGMPQLDGFHVVKQLREKSACKDSFVMAVTGYADDAHRLLSDDAGFDDYLVKPLDPAQLLQLLPERVQKHSISSSSPR